MMSGSYGIGQAEYSFTAVCEDGHETHLAVDPGYFLEDYHFNG